MKAALAHLDAMFAHLPQTRRLIGAKANLRLLMEERFSELVVHGYSANEAIGAVISEYGNLDKMAQRLGIVEILRGDGAGGATTVSGAIPAQRVVHDSGDGASASAAHVGTPEGEDSNGARASNVATASQSSHPTGEGGAQSGTESAAAQSGGSGRISPEARKALAANGGVSAGQSVNAALNTDDDRQQDNVLGASGYGVSGKGPTHSAGHYSRRGNLASDGRFLLFSAVFWLLAAIIYFVWGFVFHGWAISWVILVIAAVIYCAAYFYLRSRS